jgi:hypothetical protein
MRTSRLRALPWSALFWGTLANSQPTQGGMMSRIRRHLTYANAMATLAIFLVLGGGAYAAFHLPKNSVRSRNIVNNQVLGKDVKESSLGKVPSSANGARRIDSSRHATDPDIGASDPAAHVLLKLHELTVRASCIDLGAHTKLQVSFTSSVAGDLDWHGVRYDYPTATAVLDSSGFAGGGGSYSPIRNQAPSATNYLIEDHTAIYRNAKRTITVAYHTDVVHLSSAEQSSCVVEGTAVSAPG